MAWSVYLQLKYFFTDLTVNYSKFNNFKKVQNEHAVILRTMFKVLKQSSIKNINSHQTT